MHAVTLINNSLAIRLSLGACQSYSYPLFQISMASADVEYRCFVGGLAWATDNYDLEKAFSQYGDVVESKVRIAYDLTQFGSGISPSRSDL